jgi:FPC/CPF motif-containing protein YcgG
MPETRASSMAFTLVACLTTAATRDRFASTTVAVDGPEDVERPQYRSTYLNASTNGDNRAESKK